MKLLFIARTYPPLIGGMERFASNFYNSLKKLGDIDLLANPGGTKTLIPFFFKAIFYLIKNSKIYDVIHFSDAILSPILPVIRVFSKAKITFTVHGLDVVYSRYGYQILIPFFLRKADKIFAVSQYTLEQCKRIGISSEQLTVIPNCINTERYPPCSQMELTKFEEKFNAKLGEKIILLTVGRLIKRKGHAWFITNVFCELPETYIYVMAGFGPEFERIKNIIQKLNLEKRVHLLGHISDEKKNCLYQISNIFIMPNISVANDQEGFGIVAIEAGSYGIPVIASDIEGIRDAIIEGSTGHLIKEKDVQAFVKAILFHNIDKSSLRDKVLSNFDCTEIAKRYIREFESLTRKFH
jgi:glycosyltransferase involved in cell wall biosynthesis